MSDDLENDSLIDNAEEIDSSSRLGRVPHRNNYALLDLSENSEDGELEPDLSLDDKDKADQINKKQHTLFDPIEEKSEEKVWGKPSINIFRKLWPVGRPELLKIVCGMVALLISSLANLTIPGYIGSIMDVLGKEGSTGLSKIMIKLSIVFIISAIFTWVRNLFFSMASEKIVARLRSKLFNKYLTMEVAFYDINRTGELLNRLATDTTLVQSVLTTNISQSLRSLALALGGMIILFVISWKLTMVMLIVLPIMGVITWVYGKYIKKLSKEVQDALAEATIVAEETIGNMRVVRSFNAETKVGSIFGSKVLNTYNVAKKRAILDGGFDSLTTLIVNFCIAGILWYGGYLVIKSNLTPGVLTSYILYVFQTAAGFVSLSTLFAEFMKAMGASERIFELLGREPTVRFEGGKTSSKDLYMSSQYAPLARVLAESTRLDTVDPLNYDISVPANAPVLHPEFIGNIEFKDVDFTYPSRLDHPVLKQLNLKLEPGKTIALVGPSGGGKSTIAHLLMGIYYPTGGQILVDGIPTTDIDPSFLRDNISIVNQEPTLFACTILDNITYGVPNSKFTSEEQRLRKATKAAKLANAHDFITSFPEGYSTMVGERGIRLSGGQKQRVAIARALLKNPRILILDEATSALDSESEHLVKQALDDLITQQNSSRTYLVIAHRLSTVKNADVVAVVESGKIVESGTHDELIAIEDGTYKKLISRQLAQD